MSDYAYRVLTKIPTDTDWEVTTGKRFYMCYAGAHVAVAYWKSQDSFYSGNSNRGVPEYKVQRVALGEWEDIDESESI